jgi:hypothetical protein
VHGVPNQHVRTHIQPQNLQKKLIKKKKSQKSIIRTLKIVLCWGGRQRQIITFMM